MLLTVPQVLLASLKNHSNTTHSFMTCLRIEVEPGYNDIGLYDTSSIVSALLWYKLLRQY